MLFGQARSFALIVLPFLLGPALSAPCDISTADISGLGEEIEFSSANKLSVLGFSATVSYVTLPPGKSVV
jgi:hypothetical protein